MDTILVVEDEIPIQTMLGYILKNANFKMIAVTKAQDAYEQISLYAPDLILIDWMLPDLSGLTLLQSIKQDISLQHIPMIMLTARNNEHDKVTALNTGADDYIIKPFSSIELIARIHAVLRRSRSSAPSGKLICKQLVLDPISHCVTIQGQTLDIGPIEFRLLKFFMQNPNRAYSRDQLLKHVWGSHMHIEEGTVNVHILRLRKSLMPWPEYSHSIQTVRGIGYRFTPENAPTQRGIQDHEPNGRLQTHDQT